jgi:hypothetical protein
MAVRKKAIVTNAMEAVGESVEQPRRRSRRAMDLFTRRSATCRSSVTTVSTIYRHIRLPQRIVTARAVVNFFRQIAGFPNHASFIRGRMCALTSDTQGRSRMP